MATPGEDGFPSNGRIAWALWGGDPGQRRASSIVEQLDAADERAGTETPKDDSMTTISDVLTRQTAGESLVDLLAELLGMPLMSWLGTGVMMKRVMTMT